MMNFPISLLVLLVGLSVDACPFATTGVGPVPEHHPELQRRAQSGFFAPDGYLIGTPSRANGATELPGMTAAVDESGATLADVLATASDVSGVDVCLVRFQQLPPPAEGLYDFNQNEVDRQTFLTYADLMTQRFYNLSTGMRNGGIIFAGCTIGYSGAEAMCNAGIDTDRFCDPRVVHQMLRNIVTQNNLGEKGSVVPPVGNLRTTLLGISSIEGPLTVAEDIYQWWTNYCGYVDGEQLCTGDICAACAGAAPCFSDGGCSAYDKETGQWTGEEYSECNSEQAIQCAECFPDCYLAYQSSELCALCAAAAVCFSSDGCAVFDLEAGLWDGPFTGCNDGALTCVQCFPACEEGEEETDGTTQSTAPSAAAPQTMEPTVTTMESEIPTETKGTSGGFISNNCGRLSTLFVVGVIFACADQTLFGVW